MRVEPFQQISMTHAKIGQQAIEALGHGPDRLTGSGQATGHLRDERRLTAADALDRQSYHPAQAFMGRISVGIAFLNSLDVCDNLS